MIKMLMLLTVFSLASVFFAEYIVDYRVNAYVEQLCSQTKGKDRVETWTDESSFGCHSTSGEPL